MDHQKQDESLAALEKEIKEMILLETQFALQFRNTWGKAAEACRMNDQTQEGQPAKRAKVSQ